jgi:WD40-like Beta Propeller Repeat
MGKKGAAAVALAVGALAAAGAIIASAGETTSVRDGATPARADATSARNGKISFDRFFARAEQGDIHAVAADGSGRVALVRSRADETESAWSPDGARFAYARIVGFGKSGIFIRNRVLLGPGVPGAEVARRSASAARAVHHQRRRDRSEARHRRPP